MLLEELAKNEARTDGSGTRVQPAAHLVTRTPACCCVISSKHISQDLTTREKIRCTATSPRTFDADSMTLRFFFFYQNVNNCQFHTF